VENLFPRALLACIGEGRSPEPREISLLAEKIWREAVSRRSSGEFRQALGAARMALIGQTGNVLPARYGQRLRRSNPV